MIQKICKLFVLIAFFSASPAFALQSDSRQPIQIEADQGSLDQANQSTTFSGNVVIRQGTLNISAARVNVTRGGKGGESVRAEAFASPLQPTLTAAKARCADRQTTLLIHLQAAP